jgi:effector-binding domain-containing protein
LYAEGVWGQCSRGRVGRQGVSMIDAPRIIQVTSIPSAVIRIVIPRGDMPKVMGPSIIELMGELESQGIEPVGPLFAHHLKMEPGVFDFELGVPVSARVVANGRVMAGELPSARVARTIHRGPYEGLGPAWGEFDAWIHAQGHRPAADLWESYVAGPESSLDPADWRTELTRPLQG